MDHHRLGSTGVRVSRLAFGTMTFGGDADADTSRALFHRCLDAGIDHFDTADVYGNKGGSEEIIGRALVGRRDRVVLGTKFGHDLGDGETARGARPYIRKAVEASLRRLGTDWIDLYQLHVPDLVTPIEETLSALTDLVRQGKVRYVGASNFVGWQLMSAENAALLHGYERLVSLQPQYSLVERGLEYEIGPAAQALGIGLIPWAPLAQGMLTGKYDRSAGPASGTRIAEADLDRVERLEAFAAERGVTLLDVAIGGLAAVPGVASVIAGATKPEQVRANAKAGRWEPSADDLAGLRAL